MSVKNAVGLPDDDAIWAIFLALQHHQALYEDIPAKISTAAREACENVSTAAEAQTIARLSEAVADTAEQIAGRRSWRSLFLAGAVAVGVYGVSMAAMFQMLSDHYDTRIADYKAATMERFTKAVEARVAEHCGKSVPPTSKQR
ncbi:MAG: hypothetical protein Q7R40_15325 [Phaeospirillum sp.]|nr:hypothetical protein [Phaeospirillum sp.]